MRWFLMASPILRGGNLVVTEQGIREGVRQALLPLWNSYYFFALYANAENYTASSSVSSAHVLDRYILGKTRAVVQQMRSQLDVYDIAGACGALRDYLEVLTNWYIRRSRSRFWEGDRAALDTLWTVLETVTRAAAPLLPMTAETIWRGLTGEASVHLCDWPSVDSWPSDTSLESTMDLTRSVCSVALSLRKARQLRVRLPLASLTVAHPDAPALTAFAELIKDEVNVKDLVLSDSPASLGTVQLSVNPRVLGPRLGKQVQEVIRAVKAGDWSADSDASGVTAGGVELQPGEYELRLTAADPDSTAALSGSDGLIALDTVVTPALALEGVARDVVRVVQQARRDLGFDVSDRIALVVGAASPVADAVRAHADFIAGETLATSLTVVDPAEVAEVAEVAPQPVGDGGEVRVTISHS
jgi:isoleucyl-tRNA synthetase